MQRRSPDRDCYAVSRVPAQTDQAAYRLACVRFLDLRDEDVHRVRAAFHHVRSNAAAEPAALVDAAPLDAAGPLALVAGELIEVR